MISKNSIDQRMLLGAYEQILEEAKKSYSAKQAAAGKDIGKSGKNFKKIEKAAAKKYGSEEAGKKVAGAVLAKLRNKNK